MANETVDTKTQPDWEALARALGVASVEEAQRRAFDIAKFVVRVANDSNSKLMLKTRGKTLDLTLNR